MNYDNLKRKAEGKENEKSGGTAAVVCLIFLIDGICSHLGV